MLREIKFDYIFRDKVSGNTKHMLLKLETIENGGISGFTYVFNEIIAKRQYTGLKDKNGVEIYNGDILAYRMDGEDELYGAVAYGKSDSIFAGTYTLVDVDGFATDYAFEDEGKAEEWKWLEVIGNIYENKELLEASC